MYTNVWYGVFINLNQRQKTIDIKLYKRNTDIQITYVNPATFDFINISSTDVTGNTQAKNAGYQPITNNEVLNNYSISNFEMVYSTTYTNIENKEFTFDNTIKLIGSDINYSNLRIFNDVVEEDHINSILNEHIIKDAGMLILADNANRKIYTNNHENKNFR